MTIFIFDVDFVADNDSFTDDAQTTRVSVQAKDFTDAHLAAVQIVAARGVVPVASRIARPRGGS